MRSFIVWNIPRFCCARKIQSDTVTVRPIFTPPTVRRGINIVKQWTRDFVVTNTVTERDNENIFIEETEDGS